MDQLNSMTLSDAAAELLAAARSLPSANGHPSMPLYFLVSQSIELSLTAYTRGCGAASEQRMKIGHDLEKALNIAQARSCSRLF